MKKAFFIGIALAVVMTACNSGADKKAVAASSDPKELTTIQWIDSVQNMGTVTAGQEVKINFRFKNVGDKPLVIQSVHPSCGCTVADYPKDPIAPGQEGEITGAFDSKGKEGMQHKTITVMANTKGNQQSLLSFDIEVQKPNN